MRPLAILLIALAVFAAGCMGGTQETPADGKTTTTQASATTQKGATATTAAKATTSTTLGPDEEPPMPPSITIKLPANVTNCTTLDNATIRDVCLFDPAGRNKDMNVCGQIESKNIQLKCKARLEDNSEYCDQIDTLGEKDYCYRMMAFKWNKISYCKMAFYQGIKDKCTLDFVRDKKADPYECFQIASAGMRDECIYYHIDLYNKTGAGIKPTLCGLINNESLEMKCNETYLGQKPGA
jgi:hypothetical protein